MRILHLADLHLGWLPDYLGEKRDERTVERDGLLARAADFALDTQNGIDAVIVAGDLFETHKPPRPLVERVINQLQRLTRAGLFVLTVPGNHDEITYHDSVFRMEASRWPGVLADNPNPQEIFRHELDGKITAFYGLAYTGGITRTSPPLAEFPKTQADRHIGVLHGSLNWDAGDRSLPISSEAVALSGYDYLALGHIHSHSVRYLGKTVVCYAGATEAKTFHDPGCGNFTVVAIRDDVRVAAIEANCRPCLTHNIDVSEFDHAAQVAQTIENLADSRAMVRIILTGQSNFHLDAAMLQEKHAHLYYHLDIKSENIALDDGMIAGLAAEPTIRGHFVRNILARFVTAENEEDKEILRRALMHGVAALQRGEKS